MTIAPEPKPDRVAPANPSDSPPDEAPATIPHEIQRPDPSRDEPGKGPLENPARP